MGGAEGFHLRLAVFADFLRRNRAVLVLVDLCEERVLTGGELLLRNLAVLVGVGHLQQVNESRFRTDRHAILVALAGRGETGRCGRAEHKGCAKSREGDFACGHRHYLSLVSLKKR
ncbi:hypothetical protein D3C72_1278970 [compost metagenome]